jgi:hypothetical protein
MTDTGSSQAKLDLAQVCTLSPEGLNERLAWIRDEILPFARSSERLVSGRAWELDEAPGLAEKIDRLIALERQCCDGIVFERLSGSQPGRLRLEVCGIDPDAEVLRALDARPKEGDTRRLAKAGGFGFLAALGVCCALPMAASALLGGAAVASLSRLDQPWAIGLGTLSATAAAWWCSRGAAQRREAAARVPHVADATLASADSRSRQLRPDGRVPPSASSAFVVA